MGKEAYDDYKRNVRDKEANSQKYLVLDPSEYSESSPEGIPHTRSVPSSSLRVGDLVVLEKNQRVPADLILLRTSDNSGTCFIRTDQLDGETDWKLRVAVPACQKLSSDRELLSVDAEIYGASARFYSRAFCRPLRQRMLLSRTYTHSSEPSPSTHPRRCWKTMFLWSKFLPSSR